MTTSQGRENGRRAPLRIAVDPARGVHAAGVDLEELRSTLCDLALAKTTTHQLTARDLDDALEAFASLRSTIAAVEAKVLTARAEQIRAEDADAGVPESRRGRRAAMQASIAAREDLSSTRGKLYASQRLVRDMPTMFTALARGTLREAAAMAIGRAVGPVEPEQRALLDEHLDLRRPYMDGASSGAWRREVDRLVHQLDPRGQHGRAIRAAAQRSVSITPAAHGMADVRAHVPALEATAIRKALSLHAEAQRAQGDRRGHSAIMADRFCDLLIGRDEVFDPIRLEIGVLITERSLLAPEHGEPAVLEGYGSVSPHLLPEWVREHPEPLLRRLFTHPCSSELVATESRARIAPAGLGRLVAWRDQRCRAPFCDAPIRQIDHVTPWAHGGATDLENLQGLCQHCNSLKEQVATVTPQRIGGRHVTHWETGTGRIIHASAPILADPSSRQAAPPQAPSPTVERHPRLLRPTSEVLCGVRVRRRQHPTRGVRHGRCTPRDRALGSGTLGPGVLGSGMLGPGMLGPGVLGSGPRMHRQFLPTARFGDRGRSGTDNRAGDGEDGSSAS